MALLPALALVLAAEISNPYIDFRVFPPAPTSDTPITLRLTTICGANATTSVARTSDAVTITVPATGCPSPPIEIVVYQPIGKLEPGSYKLRYKRPGIDEVIEAGMIHVRSGTNPAPLDVHPSIARTNPAGLRVRVSLTDPQLAPGCVKSDCSDLTILVGGAAVKDVRREGNAVTFEPPPHAVGLADLVFGKWTVPAAILYADGPDLAAFERILFPVLFDAPGANGSLWRSEAVVDNPNPWFVENWNSIEPIVCITFPCGERLAPNSMTPITGGIWPHGVVLYAGRQEAPFLNFALRVRDVSREAVGFGTEVPVVREKDFVLDRRIRLLDVPLDPRYRVKLRYYGYDLGSNYAVAVRVLDPQTNQVKATYPLLHTGLDRPLLGYGEADLPPGAVRERVTLEIEPPAGSPSWAFATVTNNATQEVTIVSPQ